MRTLLSHLEKIAKKKAVSAEEAPHPKIRMDHRDLRAGLGAAAGSLLGGTGLGLSGLGAGLGGRVAAHKDRSFGGSIGGFSGDFLGGRAGILAGHIAGNVVSKKLGVPGYAMPAATVGMHAGRALGAGAGATLGSAMSNYSHKSQAKDKREATQAKAWRKHLKSLPEKKASLSNFLDSSTKSASFDRVSHRTEAEIWAHLGATEKTAEYSAAGSIVEAPEDSRKRRLAELLKKREHTGTSTGSASPNPPKGS